MINVALLVVSLAAANAAPPGTAPDLAALQAEMARLQQELREQKQLLLQLMQVDQQRYDMLLQIIRSGQGGQAAGSLPNVPSLSGAGQKPSEGARPEAPGSAAEKAIRGAGAGTISGRVRWPKDAGEAYVYVEGVRGPGGRGKTVEIKQKDKQFAPRVAVVPVGTRLSFPNMDAVFHNVFSRSAGNAFDLGGIKSGEKPGSVVVSQPGHVEIFCNIHSKMKADVLVVPNAYYAKVRSDGSFEIPSVPIGSRKLVLWGPSLKTASQRVDVTPGGASATFAPELEANRPHTNKFGQPYGSYDE
jgi:plastocyanin